MEGGVETLQPLQPFCLKSGFSSSAVSGAQTSSARCGSSSTAVRCLSSGTSAWYRDPMFIRLGGWGWGAQNMRVSGGRFWPPMAKTRRRESVSDLVFFSASEASFIHERDTFDSSTSFLFILNRTQNCPWRTAEARSAVPRFKFKARCASLYRSQHNEPNENDFFIHFYSFNHFFIHIPDQILVGAC